MSYDPYNQQPQQPGGGYNAYSAFDEPYKNYQEPKFPHGGNTEIKVESVLFVPTGTYNQQYRRPYVTNYTVENASTVHDAVAAAYRQHNIAKSEGRIHAEAKYMVDPMTLAGISASFIQPSAVAESQAMANLAGGWGDQHGRFMMSLWVKRHEAVVPTRYVLIGYTNYLGFTQMQNIDPLMELNINTIFEVRDVQVDRGFGLRTEQQMIQVNQVLVDHHFQGPDQAQSIRLRPFEVATSLARLNDPMLAGHNVTTIDTRDIQSGTPQFSNQHHTNPNNYMASVISGLVNGYDLSRQTNRNGAVEPYHAAARELRDASAQKDPFIMAISRASNNGTITSTFKWRDLLRLDPNAEADGICFIQWRDRLQFIGSVGENMSNAGESSNWNGQDYSTQVAVQIANMVPSLMVDLALRKVDLFASNVQGQPICVATNGVGVMQNVDMSPQLQAISTLFFQQCVLPMTFNGGILYEISVQTDLFGETVIKLRLDANPAYTYVEPTYCSSAKTPVLSTRRDTLDNLSQAFNNLQKEALPANPVRPLIHDLAYGTANTTTGKRY